MLLWGQQDIFYIAYRLVMRRSPAGGCLSLQVDGYAGVHAVQVLWMNS